MKREVEVDYHAGPRSTHQVADQYGEAYVTESIAWAVAWAAGPDSVTWQLLEREYQLTEHCR